MNKFNLFFEFITSSNLMCPIPKNRKNYVYLIIIKQNNIKQDNLLINLVKGENTDSVEQGISFYVDLKIKFILRIYR